MSRKSITKESYRILFSRSGNQCAFPGCCHVLVDEDDDFVAQICHIEAANPGGERYNCAMTDLERASPDNLIVLCYMHHIKTNNLEDFDVDTMKLMKKNHESNFVEGNFSVNSDVIDRISKDESVFIKNVEIINEGWITEFDLAKPIPNMREPIESLQRITDNLSWIEDLVYEIEYKLSNLPEDIIEYLNSIGCDVSNFKKIKYYDNPFHNLFWEYINIGFSNRMIDIKLDLLIMKLLVAYKELKVDPDNEDLHKYLDIIKSEMEEAAEGYASYD